MSTRQYIFRWANRRDNNRIYVSTGKNSLLCNECWDLSVENLCDTSNDERVWEREHYEYQRKSRLVLHIWRKYWATFFELMLFENASQRLALAERRYFKQTFYWVWMTNTLKGRFRFLMTMWAFHSMRHSIFDFALIFSSLLWHAQMA